MFQQFTFLLSRSQYNRAAGLAKALVNSTKGRHNVSRERNDGNENANPSIVTTCDWYDVMRLRFRWWRNSRSGSACVGRLEVIFYRQREFFSDVELIFELLEKAGVHEIDSFKMYGAPKTVRNSIQGQLRRAGHDRGYLLSQFIQYVRHASTIQPELIAVQVAIDRLVAKAKAIITNDDGLLISHGMIMGLAEGYGEPDCVPRKREQMDDVKFYLGEF